MRIISSTNYTLRIPNATHYAFNPALVRVAASGLAVSATINVTAYDSDANERTFVETRDLFNGEATFNIARFLQIIFDGKERIFAPHNIDTLVVSDNVTHVSAYVVISNSDGTITPTPTFKIDAIWGALTRGESSGGVMRRTWFVNFPFSIDFTSKYGDAVDVTVDGQPSHGVSFWDHNEEDTGDWATPYLHAMIDVSQFIDPQTVNKSVHIAFPHGIVCKNDEEHIGLTAYTLTIDRTPADSDKHIYLRWIDNQGRVCYYLFKRVGSTTAVTGSSWEHDNGNVPVAYDGGTAIETNTRQTFAAQKSLTIGAKLVDEEMFAFLLTCAKSPIVDVFDGYSETDGAPLWHRVNVVAANYAQTTKAHQDFTMTINEPAQTLQSL